MSVWAQVLTAPRTFELVDIAPPAAKDLASGEVLIEYRAGSICGSDLPFYLGDFAPAATEYGVPGLPLHEVVGSVLHGGDTDLTPGQRVVGWAKYQSGLRGTLVADADRLCVVEPGYTDIEALMIQPIACVLYAVSRMGDITGCRAAVIGQGPIGVLFSHVVKTSGAHEVIGIDNVDRSRFKDAFRVDVSVHDSSNNWARTTGDSPPDLVVEAVGHQISTFNDAVEAVALGGQIYAFGVPNDTHYPVAFHRFFRKDLTLRCGTTHSHRAYLEAAQKYLNRFPALPASYFTDCVPVARAVEAYELACVPKPTQMKVAVADG